MKNLKLNTQNSPEIPQGFSKRFSHYDEIYTQLKSPKRKSPTEKLKSHKSHKLQFKGSSKMIDEKILVNIFKYFNVIELFVATGVCKAWKHLIETNQKIFKIMDLVALPKKVNSLNLIKMVGKAKNLVKLCLPESATISDTS